MKDAGAIVTLLVGLLEETIDCGSASAILTTIALEHWPCRGSA